MELFITVMSGMAVLTFIPKLIQNVRFRVFERFHFYAQRFNYGYSLLNGCNNEMGLLKDFYDGVKVETFNVELAGMYLSVHAQAEYFGSEIGNDGFYVQLVG